MSQLQESCKLLKSLFRKLFSYVDIKKWLNYPLQQCPEALSRDKLTEILLYTDLVTIPGTDIIISFCLGLRLATPAINREQELNNRREKRKAKQAEVISSTC